MAEPCGYVHLPSADDHRPDVSVISPRFCCHQAVDLSIVRKAKAWTRGNFVISNADGGLVFTVKQPCSFLRSKIIMYDAAGVPLVTLRKKVWSLYQRWRVFRGDSTEPSDLLLSVKRSSLFQLKTELDVFLANHSEENPGDFKVKGSCFETSCVVYAGNSDTILARMQKKVSAQSVFLGKDKFMATVYPNVDHAFIALLIVILDAVNRAARHRGSGGGGG